MRINVVFRPPNIVRSGSHRLDSSIFNYKLTTSAKTFLERFQELKHKINENRKVTFCNVNIL